MKRILTVLLLLPLLLSAQIKVKNLPSTITGTSNDYIIKDYYTGASGSTQKIRISDFISTYGLATATTLTGDVTGTGTGSFATTIAASAVTFGKMQAITNNKLIGSGASGTAFAEITLGTNLSFTGNILNALGGASIYTTSGTVPTSVVATITDSLTFNGDVFITGGNIRLANNNGYAQELSTGLDKVLFRVNTVDTTEIHSALNGIALKNDNNVTRILMNNDGELGINVIPTARLHVVGSGATAGTNSFLVENSAGADGIEVLDNQRVLVGGGVDGGGSGGALNLLTSQTTGRGVVVQGIAGNAIVMLNQNGANTGQITIVDPTDGNITLNAGSTSTFDNNNPIVIGHTSGTAPLNVHATLTADVSQLVSMFDRNNNSAFVFQSATNNNNLIFYNYGGGTVQHRFNSDGVASYINGTTAANLSINTSTDLGYRLGVSGNLGIKTGDLIMETAGDHISIASGANTRAGNATLVAGTVTVANTSITANTIVLLTKKTDGGTIGTITYTLSAATSFTITSDSGSDTSTYSYLLIENP